MKKLLVGIFVLSLLLIPVSASAHDEDHAVATDGTPVRLSDLDLAPVDGENVEVTLDFANPEEADVATGKAMISGILQSIYGQDEADGREPVKTTRGIPCPVTGFNCSNIFSYWHTHMPLEANLCALIQGTVTKCRDCGLTTVVTEDTAYIHGRSPDCY